jgi:hypothetical protein
MKLSVIAVLAVLALAKTVDGYQTRTHELPLKDMVIDLGNDG